MAALRLGAYDYLVKSELKLPELAAVVERALERRQLTRANRELLQDLQQAREALAQRRAQELVQIRRIGERLAGPLSMDELVQGLAELIWESLPLSCLSLLLRGRQANCKVRPIAGIPGYPRRLWPPGRAGWPSAWQAAGPCPRRPPAAGPCYGEMAAAGLTGLAAGGGRSPLSPRRRSSFASSCSRGGRLAESAPL